MKTMLTTLTSKRLAIGVGVLALASCKAADIDALEPIGQGASALHATNTDPATTLYAVTSQTTPPFTLLVTNGQGFRLECPTAVGLKALIQGAGLDASIL